jgi:hypothetical protein
MRISKLAAPLLFVAITALAVTGCEREGPAESAGEEIDESMQHMKESAEDAGDAMENKMEETGDRIEDATDH